MVIGHPYSGFIWCRKHVVGRQKKAVYIKHRGKKPIPFHLKPKSSARCRRRSQWLASLGNPSCLPFLPLLRNLLMFLRTNLNLTPLKAPSGNLTLSLLMASLFLPLTQKSWTGYSESKLKILPAKIGIIPFLPTSFCVMFFVIYTPHLFRVSLAIIHVMLETDNCVFLPYLCQVRDACSNHDPWAGERSEAIEGSVNLKNNLFFLFSSLNWSMWNVIPLK